jgi:uncharacterized protein YbjT (DUF2867 family)
MKEKILITAATGKTGYATTVELLSDGYPVRIYVRSRNKRAIQLEKLGAEVTIGGFDSYDQFKDALADIKRVYYCYPVIPGMPENVELFIRLAQTVKIESVIFMGQWLAEFPDQQSVSTNDVKKSYALLKESGLNVVYYNPGYFAENVLPMIQSIVQLGRMPSPFGDGRCPWITTGDQGRVIAALLKNPAPYFGQKVHPTGPRSIDSTEMAEIFSRVTGKKVEVMPISDKMFMKAVISASKLFGYDTTFLAVQTTFYAQEFRLNRFDVGGPTDVVRRLTGSEPQDFETFARQLINDLPDKKPSFRGRMRAIGNLIRLMFTRLPSKEEMLALNR